MKKSLTVAVLACALVLSTVAAAAAKPASGPGKVEVGVDVSEWDSSVPAGPGIYPVGGSGQVNGEFVTAERNGIQIGLRASERFAGTIDAVAGKGSKVGLYAAETSDSGVATWNYDLHVDLRDGHGVAAGTTLADYDLTLEHDVADDLFGFGNPTDLTLDGLIDDAVLVQSSQNPTFGNDSFSPTDEGTYHLRLVLTPVTFNGPPLAVAIEVQVSDS